MVDDYSNIDFEEHGRFFKRYDSTEIIVKRASCKYCGLKCNIDDGGIKVHEKYCENAQKR